MFRFWHRGLLPHCVDTTCFPIHHIVKTIPTGTVLIPMSRHRPGARKGVPLSRAQRIRWSDRELRKTRRYDPLHVKNVLDEIRDVLREHARHSTQGYESMSKLLKEVPAFPEKKEYQKRIEQMKMEAQSQREWLQRGSSLDINIIKHLSEPERVQRSLLESFEEASQGEDQESTTLRQQQQQQQQQQNPGRGITPWLDKTMGHIDGMIAHASALSQPEDATQNVQSEHKSDAKDDKDDDPAPAMRPLSEEVAEKLVHDIEAMEQELHSEDQGRPKNTRAHVAARQRKEKRLSSLREDYLILLNENKFLITSAVLPLSKHKTFERAFYQWLTSKHFKNNPGLHVRDVTGAWIDKRRLLELLEQKYILSIPERKLLPPDTFRTPSKLPRR